MEKMSGAMVALGLSALVVFGIGWVMNIIKIFGLLGQDFNLVGVEMILRGVGVFVAPLGAIAGWV